jgi:hypothetical protein
MSGVTTPRGWTQHASVVAAMGWHPVGTRPAQVHNVDSSFDGSVQTVARS